MSENRTPMGTGSSRRTTVAVALVAALAISGLAAYAHSHGSVGPVGRAADVPPAVSEQPSVAPTTTPDKPTRRKGQSGLAGQVENLSKSGRFRGGPLADGKVPLAAPTTGRFGSGLTLGTLESVTAPVGGPVTGTVTVSVANVPNRTSERGFVGSLRAVTADGEDFVLLNEVSGRSLDSMRASASGYDAYRDPVPDRSQGGSQSMNNVVMWQADRWNLVDAGRVKVVDDDRGYRQGKAFVWDRYVTWAVLQRKADGAVVSVVSSHMPTNPVKYPAQPGGGGLSRLARYSGGMDRAVATVRTLSRLGPVLFGGDMNSHPDQGAWTAAAKMSAAGYSYVKDSAVMHLFFPQSVRVLAQREIRIDSDHPAIAAALDLAGSGPTT